MDVDWESLVGPIVAARARRAASGSDDSLPIHLGALRAGDVGVVNATVVSIGLPRSFTRKAGGEGRLLRVTVRDATGEADLVLWDDEVRRAETWRPGLALRLRGVVVKAGRDGRAELGLGAARVEEGPVSSSVSPSATLAGILLAVSPDRETSAGIQAEAELALPGGGLATLVVSGAVLNHVRSLAPGTPLAWPEARPHPVLAGWWLAPSGAMPVASAPAPKP